jgi:hypothetical protein
VTYRPLIRWGGFEVSRAISRHFGRQNALRRLAWNRRLVPAVLALNPARKFLPGVDRHRLGRGNPTRTWFPFAPRMVTATPRWWSAAHEMFDVRCGPPLAYRVGISTPVSDPARVLDARWTHAVTTGAAGTTLARRGEVAPLSPFRRRLDKRF